MAGVPERETGGAKPTRAEASRAQFTRYKDDVKRRGKQFYPYAMFHDTVMSLVVVAVIVALATIWKWTSYGPHHDGTHQGLLGPEYAAPADPGTHSFVPRPDWYFYFLFYLLRIFKWPESVFLATVGIPTVCLVLLFALPFIDLRRERRLSRRPVAAVAMALTVVSMGVLTWKGATAKEALASEVIANVPHWVQAEQLPAGCRSRSEAVRHRGLHRMPHLPRHGVVEPRRARPDVDRVAQPRRRLPDPPPAMPLLRDSGLSHAEVRVARRRAPAPARDLPRSVEGLPLRGRTRVSPTSPLLLRGAWRTALALRRERGLASARGRSVSRPA